MRDETSESRKLEPVDSTAQDLREIGPIDIRMIRQRRDLRLIPSPDYSAEQIRELRKRYRISQSVLAALLNTSLNCIQKWEAGERSPKGASLRLLSILDRKGLEVLLNT
jgi:putative transcriptional regulator